MSAPLILGFDTSGPHVAAALTRGAELLESRAEDMARGQAERLMGLLQECLQAHGHDWQDLDAIAVGTGPGNFTGIRIAVSAARGLALGLGIPAYGVNGFEQVAFLLETKAPVLKAPRDQVYALGDAGPLLRPRATGDSLLPEGSAAQIARAIATLAQRSWPATPPPPAALYVKPADAAPPRDAPPLILDP